MADSSLERKLALLQARPKISGRILNASGDSLVLHNGNCIIEVSRDHVVSQTKGQGDIVELTIANDAELVVGAVVSMQNGFVADNVFGMLVPDILANNCNCNCNCESGNCNCNCNCSDCTECSRCTSSLPSIEDAPPLVFRRPFVGTFNNRTKVR